MAYSHTKFQDGIDGLFDPNGVSEINMIKCKKIEFNVDDLDAGNEVALKDVNGDEVTFNATSYIVAAFLKITTPESTGTTKTVNIGTATGTGDPDGLIASGNVSALATLVGAGALVGALIGTEDEIVITPGSANFAELAGTLYIFYIEIAD